MRTWTIALTALLLAGRATSEEAAADSSQALQTAYFAVTSSPDSAWVFLEATLVGRTPCIIRVTPPWCREVRVFHPDFANWLTDAVEDTLTFEAGDTLARNYILGAWTMVVSSPSGGEVSLGDSLLGTTPLILPEGSVALQAQLTVHKPGYEPAVACVAQARQGILSLPLVAQGEQGRTHPSLIVAPRSSLRLYLSGAGAILAGATAAYFKVKADDRNDSFLTTGDPALARERNHYDTASAVAFAVTQVSFGLFIMFLLSE
jgi:hypothetical protein